MDDDLLFALITLLCRDAPSSPVVIRKVMEAPGASSPALLYYLKLSIDKSDTMRKTSELEKNYLSTVTLNIVESAKII